MTMDVTMEEGVKQSWALVEQATTTGLDLAIAYGPKLLLALIVLFAGMSAIKGLLAVMEAAMVRAKVEVTLQKFLISIIGVAAKAVLLVVFASMIGVDTATLIAMLGAAGLAVGLALQGSLSNLAGGVLILFFKPFKVGDVIEAQGYTGVVKEIQIFNTIMTTPDNQRIIIPNGNLSNGVVRNITAEPTRRVELPIGISYDADVDKVRALLLALINSDSRVLADPAPEVRLTGYGESSVNLSARLWTKTEDYWPTHFELLEKVKTTFDREGISIPFPHRHVLLHHVKE